MRQDRSAGGARASRGSGEPLHLRSTAEYLWRTIEGERRVVRMGLMSGKKGVIFGVANDKSIAWGISRKLHAEGATLAFTYLNEVFEKRVRPLAESIGADLILRCDVTKDTDIEGVYTEIEQKWE